MTDVSMSNWLKQTAAHGRVSSLVEFLKYVVQRFVADRCTSVAASLSFTSMLSMVPIITIAFALFAAFPIFEDMKSQLMSLVFENFLPAAGDVVREQLDLFSSNASRTSAIGAIVLIFTTIMTLTTIEKAYNLIWRAEAARPLFQRLMLYWAFMTMGPLLMGASISVSSYVFAMRTYVLDAETAEAGFSFLANFIPFILASLAFIFGYKVVPNRQVEWKHAIIGGLVAGALFDLLKNAFGWYVSHFPSYEAVYGAMAVLPLFMIWLNLVWNAVLIGAEVTAALPEWAAIRSKESSQVLPGGKRLVLVLRLLKQFGVAARTGEAVAQRQLQDASQDLVAGLQTVLFDLRKAGYLVADDEGAWRLCRDLGEVPMYVLLDDLGYGVPSIDMGLGQDTSALRDLMRRVRDLTAEQGAITVKAFMAQT